MFWLRAIHAARTVWISDPGARSNGSSPSRERNFSRQPRIHSAAIVAAMACAFVVAACGARFETEPLVEYSTELLVQGDRSQSFARRLRAGTYLVEVRERDIDLRVKVDTDDAHVELADAYLRHGLHRTVVRLPSAQTLRITLTSIDQRTWRAPAAVRILRWPESAADAGPDERLLGFSALGKGNELIAGADTASWRAGVRSLRAAADHFRTAGDIRTLAETEYQKGFAEFNLLFDFEASRKSAELAQAHFAIMDDELGAARANLLLSLAELNLANEKAGGEHHAQLDVIRARLIEAQRFFEEHGTPSDALQALTLRATPDEMLGRYDQITKIYLTVRARARERGDKFYEASATQNLAYVASRKGEMVRAAAMFENVLPLIDRDRNPDFYATVVGNLGHTLIALGDFDRALMLQTEALEMFRARGDDGQTARTLAELGAIQFRTGDVERALDSLRSALPLFENAGDVPGLSAALRLTGNAAAQLEQHDVALEYLRRSEQVSPNPDITERTRVLIAGELRELGNLRGADATLASVLRTKNEQTRADALAERARLRQRQQRAPEALADLRTADAIYARLKLDFNRIDSSSALALALLDAGDVRGAGAAADTAIAIETRIRVKSANPEMRARFLSASYAPYEARIEADLAGALPDDPTASWMAFRTAEAIRARSLVDRLAHSARAPVVPRDPGTERLREKMTALQLDLERRTRRSDPDDSATFEIRREIDEARAQLEARFLVQRGVQASDELTMPASREAVQAALPADTAVLAYFVGDRRSHAWLLTRSELRHATLPGRRSLQNIVNSFVEQQRAGKRTSAHAPLAVVVGDLLRGVSAKRLLVLPDGPLNGLPFAALPLSDARPRELLVDRYVVTAAPSLALALRPGAGPASRPTRVAVVSDPVYTPDDRRLTLATNEAANYRGAESASGRLARLPYSAIEARAVVRAFEGADIIELAGFNATARRVIELPSRELDVLHFATHAVARRDAPEQSALFLSEFAADGSPLALDRLTTDDIVRSGLRADVVVLSGCATGDGRELRGEGVLGLTYGFLANGSSTVVASLWPVEDALTARFMEEFYAAYRASGRAPDALRAAQLRTRGSGADSVWSSFVVRANGMP
jgi:CHAT domain-containing protein